MGNILNAIREEEKEQGAEMAISATLHFSTFYDLETCAIIIILHEVTCIEASSLCSSRIFFPDMHTTHIPKLGILLSGNEYHLF